MPCNPGHIAGMAIRTARATVDVSATGLAPRLRRYLNVLMAVVVLAASLTLAVREPAKAMAVNGVAAEITLDHPQQPKPCRKNVLASALGTCPGFSFTAIAISAANAAAPVLAIEADWQLSNSALPPQCLGFSPYRPPCLVS